jgi:MFS family permease
VPGKKRTSARDGGKAAREKSKLPPGDIYYSALITFLYFMNYMAIGTNMSTHLKDAGFGEPSTAGIAIAIQMAGGVVSGAFFGKLSLRFGDLAIAQAFVALFIGFMVLSLGQSVLISNFIGVFIAGLSPEHGLPVSASFRRPLCGSVQLTRQAIVDHRLRGARMSAVLSRRLS